MRVQTCSFHFWDLFHSQMWRTLLMALWLHAIWTPRFMGWILTLHKIRSLDTTFNNCIRQEGRQIVERSVRYLMLPLLLLSSIHLLGEAQKYSELIRRYYFYHFLRFFFFITKQAFYGVQSNEKVYNFQFLF